MRVICLVISVLSVVLSTVLANKEHPLEQVANFLDLSIHVESDKFAIASNNDPTFQPTAAPSISPVPSASPSAIPTHSPTAAPSRTPTQRPSQKPTIAPGSPTAAPSLQVFPVVTFDATFSMTLSSSNITNQDKQAIVEATATTLSLPSDYVTFVSATPAARRLLRSVADIIQGNVDLESVNMNIVTNVQAPAVNFPSYSSNTSALISFLSQTLTQAVSDGSYAVTLQDTAIALGLDSGDAVFSATVNGVVIEDVAVEQPAADDDDEGMSSRMIILAAGVVIAGIIFIAFIAALLSLLSGFIIDQDLKKKAQEKASRNVGTSVIVQDQDFHEVYSENGSPQEKPQMMFMPKQISGRLEITDSTGI